ncbi:hypothetical protein [Salinarchaeum laminariae]|uniref:hypothetical protein n=1 Tax=Salinarchaeum laminariae TaxID=869888 RepID=UPI0020BF9745|nr:hypothetical protein [Salinarchaeum laminariae]
MAGRSASDRTIARPGTVAREETDRPSAPEETDAGASARDEGAPTVVERTVYRNGDADDAVDLAIVYEIPESVSKLAFWIERPQVTVVATDGFDPSDVEGYTWQGAVDGPAFEWDGTGDRATVLLRQPVDATPATYGAGADDWALCLRPRTHTRWRYRGTEPRIDRAASVRGTGTAGEQFAFLGAYECEQRRVPPAAPIDDRSRLAGSGRSAEMVRLVVPTAATLAAGPDRVLDSLVAASTRLAVGGRNDVVTVFVAPTEGVTWAHRGLSLGPDARVNDAAPLAAPTNIWVHEYVHTRQDREAVTPATEWLLEATAEYYAVTQAFERGAIGFQEYRTVLERGVEGQPAGAVLADPTTWADDAQYRKGALVVAALDRRIRAATGGERTFQSVLSAWTAAAPGSFDAAAFADAVEAAGGPAARAAAVAYTQRPTAPSCWSGAAHAAAFDVSPADCGVESARAGEVALGDGGCDLARSD